MAEQRARTEHEARQRYVDFLSLPLNCVTKAIWVTTQPFTGPEGSWTLTIASRKGDPVRLRRQDGTVVFFTALQRFRPRLDEHDAWRMRTEEYNYTVWEEEPDRSLKPVMQWHYHPGSGTSDSCHLHVRTAEFMCGKTTRKLHIPSERVAFESVVRFLIDELGVTPRRNDWEAQIQSALDAFMRFRTWSGRAP